MRGWNNLRCNGITDISRETLRRILEGVSWQATKTSGVKCGTGVPVMAWSWCDHRTHAVRDAAIGDYVRWRNQHARPIRDSAVGSKIRRPDYAAVQQGVAAGSEGGADHAARG